MAALLVLSICAAMGAAIASLLLGASLPGALLVYVLTGAVSLIGGGVVLTMLRRARPKRETRQLARA